MRWPHRYLWLAYTVVCRSLAISGAIQSIIELLLLGYLFSAGLICCQATGTLVIFSFKMISYKRPEKFVQRYYTPNEVSVHNTIEDLWVSFLGKVYNLTPLCDQYKGMIM